jgi:hypothetical protein
MRGIGVAGQNWIAWILNDARVVQEPVGRVDGIEGAVVAVRDCMV